MMLCKSNPSLSAALSMPALLLSLAAANIVLPAASSLLEHLNIVRLMTDERKIILNIVFEFLHLQDI